MTPRAMLLLLMILLSQLACIQDWTEHDPQTLTASQATVERGKEVIRHYGCASCHKIPGIAGADGNVGPPLDRIGGRVYIAGVLLNTPGNMENWIRNPPAVDAKTAMPNLGITDREIHDIASYLYTLR